MKNKIENFYSHRLTNLKVIFGGDGDDGGTVEKKKLKKPGQGVNEEGNDD